MERWGVRECVCAVELFIQTGSITEIQRGFCCEQNQQEAPYPNAIRQWVKQWREEGSVKCKKPPAWPSSVRTPDSIARVLAFVSRSPRRCARKHPQALRMSDRSVQRILLTDLSFHPHKLQVVHALSNRDREMISIAALGRLFPQRVISCFGDVPWRPRSPDLTAPDFFLWGYLKSKVYSTRPTDLHALKENIWEEIAKLSEETLQAVMHRFLTRVHLCIEEGGGHLKDIVHKK